MTRTLAAALGATVKLPGESTQDFWSQLQHLSATDRDWFRARFAAEFGWEVAGPGPEG